MDADGNPVNYRNWYYLVSDDNILINNCKSDNFSTSVWKEFKYLYKDLAGAEIPYTSLESADHVQGRPERGAGSPVRAAQ